MKFVTKQQTVTETEYRGFLVVQGEDVITGHYYLKVLKGGEVQPQLLEVNTYQPDEDVLEEVKTLIDVQIEEEALAEEMFKDFFGTSNPFENK